MTIAAVIPLKSLSKAKSRLSPHLTPGERVALMRGLAERTVRVLRHCPEIGAIALATEERVFAAELGVTVVDDPGSLNLALAAGAEWAARIGFRGLLILPADLPKLTAADVRTFIAAAGSEPSVTVAPTRDGGTGALLLRPPNAIAPFFGRASFTAHLAAAAVQGIRATPVHLPRLGEDLDTIRDLADAMPFVT